MIYITLPEFYYNFNTINRLAVMPKNFLKWDLSFSASGGNFPHCVWNGGFNSNFGGTALYNDVINCLDQVKTPIRFNCANIYMKKADLDDDYGNFILDKARTGVNQIAFANLDFCEYFQKTYPEYDLVFSREADLMYPMTPQIINAILEQNIFKLVEIPASRTNDIDFLKEIKSRDKIELQINTICSRTCMHLKGCQYHEHQAQYDYSGANNYLQCKECFGYDLNSTALVDDLDQYIKMGINHFSLAPYYSQNAFEILAFIVRFFVKEELREKAFENLMLGGELHD